MRRTLLLAGLAVCSLTACTDDVAPVIEAEDPPVFQFQWGWIGVEPGRFLHPTALDIGPDGSIYVADQTPRIQKFAPDGTYLTSWGNEAIPEGDLPWALSSLTVSRSAVLVAASFSAIYRFTHDGSYLDRISTLGLHHKGLAVDEDGIIYVSGSRAEGKFPNVILVSHLLKLAPDGTLLADWRDVPAGPIALGPGHTLFVLEDNRREKQAPVVWEFNTSGRFLRKWRVREAEVAPEDIGIDPGGNVYLVRGVNGTALKFTAGGRLLAEWRKTDGNHEPLAWPSSIALDPGGDPYIVDYQQNRVVKFAYP